MSQRPNVADHSSHPPIRIADGQLLSNDRVLKVGQVPVVGLTKEPSSSKSVFADSQRHFKQWEQTEDGSREMKGRQLVAEIIESKRILTLECSKEILRLTHLVRDLQQEQQSIRKAYELKYPSCYPSRPPSSRHINQNIEEQSEPPPRKVVARGIRKVQRSMQFDGQDVAALFGGLCAGHKMQIGANIPAEAKEQEETDVYQLEIEISDKRENADQVEYQVRKKISFSRWQSLQNLKKENLHDFVKIFDRKLKEGGLSVQKNHVGRNLNVKKTEVQNNSSTDSGSEIVVVTQKNQFSGVGNKLSSTKKDAISGGIDQIVGPSLNDLNIDGQPECSEEDLGNADWFNQHSEENYNFSDISSSDVQTMEVRSSIGSNSPSDRSQGSQSPLSKKESLAFKPTLTERAPSNNQRIPSIE